MWHELDIFQEEMEPWRRHQRCVCVLQNQNLHFLLLFFTVDPGWGNWFIETELKLAIAYLFTVRNLTSGHGKVCVSCSVQTCPLAEIPEGCSRAMDSEDNSFEAAPKS